MSLERDTNTEDTNKIGMDMQYQEDIKEYIKRSKELKQKLRR